LLDATYTPVNHEELSHRERNQRILRDLPILVDELRQNVGPATRVVLVKANICELLEATLIGQGFPVIDAAQDSTPVEGEISRNSPACTRIVLTQTDGMDRGVGREPCLGP
jgi:hypothetical protein